MKGKFIKWRWFKISNIKIKIWQFKFKKWNNGINFFDTAEVYGLGKGKINLDKAIQKLNIPREKIVVSIKFIVLVIILMILF